MDDTFDTEVILREILDTLEKHSIPVKTLALDISLLSQDFEEVFPQLKDYEAGHFYRPRIIKGIPASLRARRRIPFGDIITWLELNVLPFVKNVAAEVEQEFGEIKAHFQITQYEDHPRLAIKNNYNISIECRLREEPEITEGNTVMLSVGVRQHDATSYPIVYGYVGWLVDEESGGEWGIDTVYDLNPLNLEVAESTLEYRKRDLPTLRQYLLNELQTFKTRTLPDKK